MPNARVATAAGPFHKAPPAAVLPPPEVYAVWAQGVGSWGKLNGDGNATAIDHSVGGIVSGVDVTFNGLWRVGLAAGFSESNFSTSDLPVSGSSDNYSVTLYGGGQFGAWGLRGGASFGWGNIETSRQVTAVALGGAAWRIRRDDDAGVRRCRLYLRPRQRVDRAVWQPRLCPCW